jgi:hypothetical protein
MSALEHSIEEAKNTLSGLKMWNREIPLDDSKLFILLKIFVAVNMFPDEVKNAVEPDLISDLEGLSCGSYGTCDIFYKTNKQKLNVLSELKSIRPEQSGGFGLVRFLFVGALMVASSLVNAGVPTPVVSSTFTGLQASPQFHSANYNEAQADRPSMTPAVIYTSFVNGTDTNQIPNAQTNVRDLALRKGNFESTSPTQDSLWGAPQTNVKWFGYDTGVVDTKNGPTVQNEIMKMCSGLPSGQSCVGIAETSDFVQQVVIATNSGVCAVNTDTLTTKGMFQSPSASTSKSIKCYDGTFTPEELSGFGGMIQVVPKTTDLFGGKHITKFYVSVNTDTDNLVTPSTSNVVDTLTSAGKTADKVNSDVATFRGEVSHAERSRDANDMQEKWHNLNRFTNLANSDNDDDLVGKVAKDLQEKGFAESAAKAAAKYDKQASDLMNKQGVRKSSSKTGNRIPLSRTGLGGSLKRKKTRRSRRSRRSRKTRRSKKTRKTRRSKK